LHLEHRRVTRFVSLTFDESSSLGVAFLLIKLNFEFLILSQSAGGTGGCSEQAHLCRNFTARQRREFFATGAEPGNATAGSFFNKSIFNKSIGARLVFAKGGRARRFIRR
jgi:hypothetical protein